MTRLEYVGSGDYIIRDESGTQIGFLETNNNTIVQVDITKAYQGQGHGRSTINLYVEQMKSSDFDCIKTTTVTNPRLETILLDIGFEQVDDEMSNKYIYRF